MVFIVRRYAYCETDTVSKRRLDNLLPTLNGRTKLFSGCLKNFLRNKKR
ncbi:MAG: hypothetical protein IJV56_06870 [Neisseriaceae bacterium]|nr:hypothetical protein [Neisseriaceae bacterium]